MMVPDDRPGICLVVGILNGGVMAPGWTLAKRHNRVKTRNTLWARYKRCGTPPACPNVHSGAVMAPVTQGAEACYELTKHL